MRRVTTPVHKFTFPIDPTTFEQIKETFDANAREAVAAKFNGNESTSDNNGSSEGII